MGRLLFRIKEWMLKRSYSSPSSVPYLHGPDVSVINGEDGVLYLEHPDPMSGEDRILLEVLADKVREHPDAIFFEQDSASGWERASYGDVLIASEGLARALATQGLKKNDIVFILAENSIQYAVMSFAVMACGAVQAPLAPQVLTRAPEMVTALCHQMKPALVITDAGMEICDFGGAEHIELPPTYAELEFGERLPLEAALENWSERISSLGPDDLAKILFTSGSTGTPKGVVNTYGMISAGQKIQSQQFEGITSADGERYTIVDWLPWHHTFGGNSNLYSVLWNGGQLTIDKGRPTQGDFQITLDNMRREPPNAYVGVPSSIAYLVDALEADDDLARQLFSKLKAISNGGAALSAPLVSRLQALARKWRGEAVLIGGGYGMTETCAVITQIWWPDADPHTLGLPAPGIKMKLVPLDGGRYECRVKGPNVTPGYICDGKPKSDGLFDEEGYFRTGDSLRFTDPERPEQGLSFAGRLKEEFKLANGTWVRCGQLRSDLLEALAPAVQDAIVVGENRDAPGALLWLKNGAGMADVEDKLSRFNAGRSVSRRISRVSILRSPPDASSGEITSKGSLNQIRMRETRRDEIDALYTDGHVAAAVGQSKHA